MLRGLRLITLIPELKSLTDPSTVIRTAAVTEKLTDTETASSKRKTEISLHLQIPRESS